MLLIVGGPAINRAAAAVEKCDLGLDRLIFSSR